jgi:hypothetical protein
VRADELFQIPFLGPLPFFDRHLLQRGVELRHQGRVESPDLLFGVFAAIILEASPDDGETRWRDLRADGRTARSSAMARAWGAWCSAPMRRADTSPKLHSHVSLLKFCQTTFQLLPLNNRVKQSDDMSDCFNFQQKPGNPPKQAAS